MDPIERTRVVERIAVAAKAPIALIVAPAGYGKSIALAQYLATLGGAYRRYSVTAQHVGLPEFVPGGVVVVDDLHSAQDDSEAASILAALIDRTRGSVRWIVASRSIAGLPVASWQTRGDASMIVDEYDLRYTFEEARDVARPFAIGDAELRELVDLTAGWPAAMDFALGSAATSSDLRRVCASTRDMVHGYFAEQVYLRLKSEERALLALGSALPSLDPRVLERAGFDRAVSILEGLRLRTSFITLDADGLYRCHDLFREFLKRQVENEGRQRVLDVHAWAGRALEDTGDIEAALAAYAGGSSHADVVRLLESSGFLLMERARADAVASALNETSETARRERPRLLALRGMLAAAQGRATRAETLLRRAIDRAGPDRELVAIVSLKLGIAMANLGKDSLALLERVFADLSQSVAYRAEALSIATTQRAAEGDEGFARSAIDRTIALLPSVDVDDSRAKVLQRLGVASFLIGETRQAHDLLSEAADLAEECRLYSLSSRCYASLSTLSLYHDDDADSHYSYAQRASLCAERAGDVFDRQMAISRMMHSCIRRGDADAYQALEAELLSLGNPGAIGVFLAAHRGYLAAWDGRFEQSYDVLRSSIPNLHHDIDKAIVGARCAVVAAVVGKRTDSMALVRDVVDRLPGVRQRGPYGVRTSAAAIMLCALAEAINGRFVAAVRFEALIDASDHVSGAFKKALRETTAAIRMSNHAASSLGSVARDCAVLGYGDMQRFLDAVASELGRRVAELQVDSPLTRSERDILMQLAEGLRPKEIATRTGRSVHTVQSHIANLTGKLGCSGRGEAIAAARRQGIIA